VCISTVDVIYPMSPQFLLFAPALAKASLVPVLDYAKSDRWKFPFAPHDLGTYPHATGQVYGGGERSARDQMPVEETGNMLILLAAIAHADGNANFASQYWPLAQKWARFPEKKRGSIRAAALQPTLRRSSGAQRQPSARRSKPSARTRCSATCASRNPRPTIPQARARHDRALDRCTRMTAIIPPRVRQARHVEPEVQLAWDRALDLNLFARDVVDKDVAFYVKNQQKYGLTAGQPQDLDEGGLALLDGIAQRLARGFRPPSSRRCGSSE
jgi:hypothetical protein